MNCPRIEVDLSKIRRNTETLVRGLLIRGIGVTGVTKAACGNPDIAQAMLDGGALGLAESRISNVETLRNAGIDGPVTLIRTPMLSQVDQVIRTCERSYNTEIEVIAALAAAAIRNKTVHGIILMVEMGDRREGILPENVVAMALRVVKMSGVSLKGIGANFACMGGEAPNAPQMAALSTLATEIEGLCGPVIRTVSGGNSANLPWALGQENAGRINDLRLGEAILLGVDPLSGDQIGKLHTDAFTLVAEVIETSAKAAASPVSQSHPALAKLRIAPNNDGTTRLILALGRQDTDISGLSLPTGSRLIGATSDHLVIETKSAALQLGSEMRFQMNYSALMHAMAAPDVETTLIDAKAPRKSQHEQRNSAHLALA